MQLETFDAHFSPRDLSHGGGPPRTVRGTRGIPQTVAEIQEGKVEKMKTQLIVFKLMWAATAAGALFLVVHAALAAFTQSAGVLTQLQ
jgi:hypothetical protein